MSHTCKAKGCTVLIADSKLMCMDHWRLVPMYVQRQVNGTWTAMRAVKTTDLHERLAATRRYQAARDAAIAHVETMGPLA